MAFINNQERSKITFVSLYATQNGQEALTDPKNGSYFTNSFWSVLTDNPSDFKNWTDFFSKVKNKTTESVSFECPSIRQEPKMRAILIKKS